MKLFLYLLALAFALILLFALTDHNLHSLERLLPQ